MYLSGYIFRLYFLIVIALTLSCCDKRSSFVQQTETSLPSCGIPTGQGCLDMCRAYSDADRPLWCYRTYCISGSSTYGDWCSARQMSKYLVLPTGQTGGAEIHATRQTNIGFQNLLGLYNNYSGTGVSYSYAKSPVSQVLHDVENLKYDGYKYEDRSVPDSTIYQSDISDPQLANDVGIASIYSDFGLSYLKSVKVNGMHLTGNGINIGFIGDGIHFSTSGDGTSGLLSSNVNIYGYTASPNPIYTLASGGYNVPQFNVGGNNYYSSTSTPYAAIIKGNNYGTTQNRQTALTGVANDANLNVYNAMQNMISPSTVINDSQIGFSGIINTMLQKISAGVLTSKQNNDTVLNLSFSGIKTDSQIGQYYTYYNSGTMGTDITRYAVAGNQSSYGAQRLLVNTQVGYKMLLQISQNINSYLSNRNNIVVGGTGIYNFGQDYVTPVIGSSTTAPLNPIVRNVQYINQMPHGTTGMIDDGIANTQRGNDFSQINQLNMQHGNQLPIYNVDRSYMNSQNLISLDERLNGQYPSAFLLHLWYIEERIKYSLPTGTSHNPTNTFATSLGPIYHPNDAPGIIASNLLRKDYINDPSYNFLVSNAIDTTYSSSMYFGTVFRSRMASSAIDKSPQLAYGSNMCGILKYNCLSVPISDHSLSTSTNQDVTNNLVSSISGVPIIPTGMPWNYTNSIGQNYFMKRNGAPGSNDLNGNYYGSSGYNSAIDDKTHLNPSEQSSAILTGIVALMQQAVQVQNVNSVVGAKEISFALKMSAMPKYGNNYDLCTGSANGLCTNTAKISGRSTYFSEVLDDSEKKDLNFISTSYNRDLFAWEAIDGSFIDDKNIAVQPKGLDAIGVTENNYTDIHQIILERNTSARVDTAGTRIITRFENVSGTATILGMNSNNVAIVAITPTSGQVLVQERSSLSLQSSNPNLYQEYNYTSSTGSTFNFIVDPQFIGTTNIATTAMTNGVLTRVTQIVTNTVTSLPTTTSVTDTPPVGTALGTVIKASIPGVTGMITAAVPGLSVPSIPSNITSTTPILLDTKINLEASWSRQVNGMVNQPMANTFEYFRLNDAFSAKFNWQADKKIYTSVSHIYCIPGTMSYSACNVVAYENSLSDPTNDYGYRTLSIKLAQFNEHTNAIHLKMLDPHIMADDASSVNNLAHNLPYKGRELFHDVVFVKKPDADLNPVLWNQVCPNNKCDLLKVFQQYPDYFTRAPSNVHGYGVTDAKTATIDLNYQMNRMLNKILYNSGISADISTSQLNFYLNSSIVSSPEVNTRDSLSAYPGNSGNRVILGYNPSNIGLSAMMNAGPMGLLPTYQSVGIPNGIGANVSMITSTMSDTIMIGAKMVSRKDAYKYAILPHERNMDFRGMLMPGYESRGYSTIGGVMIRKDLGKSFDVNYMTFGDKNKLSLINQNKIASYVSNNSISFLADQQGMFSNPYYRIVGNHTGSAYSLNMKFFNDRLSVGYVGANAQNSLIQSMYGNYASLTYIPMMMSMGFNSGMSNSLNKLDSVEIMLCSFDNKSSYGIGFGKVEEVGGVLGMISRGIAMPNSTTSYYEAKIVHNLFDSDYYLMGHLSIGRVVSKVDKYSIMRSFSPIIARKLSIGIAKDNFFGGTIAFAYNEPNRVISGNAKIAGLSDSKEYLVWNNINLSPSSYERNQEIIYSRSFRNGTISFNFMRRQNPYNSSELGTDYAGVFRLMLEI